MKKLTILIFLFFILLSSCKERDLDHIEGVKQFSLNLGKLDSDMDIFIRQGVPYTGKNSFVQKDGFFYIVNGASSKVMKMNSFGDLIMLLYNEYENTRSLLPSGEGDTVESSRKARIWNFNAPENIGVNTSGDILIIDRLDRDKAVENEIMNAICDRILLRFDSDGHYMDYLGMEGIGGTPFPFIKSFYITENDEPVVISRTTDLWYVFWFNRDGSLKYQVELNQQHIPHLDDQDDSIIHINNMIPDAVEDELLVEVSYYVSPEDVNDHMGTLHSSRIYPLTLDSASFDYWVPVPDVQYTDDLREPMKLAGVKEDNLFFINPAENNSLYLVIVNKKGKAVLKSLLESPSPEYPVFASYALSSEGILSSMLITEDHIDFIWWRTDLYLESSSEFFKGISL